MKIGLITQDFYPFTGGQGRHIYEIVKRIESNSKIKAIVFSPTENKLKNHIQIFPITNKIGKNILFSFLLNFSIERLIKEYSLNKINVHCGPGGLFLLRKLDIPVVATCHHTYWQQYKYVNGQRWKKVFTLFEKRTYQISDKVICVSEDSKRILTEKYGINPSKIIVIPNGVDTEKFYPIESVKKINNALLYVGRIDERKGVDFLIRSMSSVIIKYPEIKLFIGGKGPLLPELENIKFIGFIPEDELNEWYNKVKCVVVPSVFEGFGITVIEAMAAGTPVIGTNVDGIKSIIRNKENGYLVEYGNTDSLANVIIDVLLNDNSKVVHLGLKTIKNEYDWKAISNEIEELYEKL
jgi:glycosyltransferase involved in cell wall biosynthesis